MQRLCLTGRARRFLLVVALIAASPAHAEYFWIDGTAGGVRILSGELGNPRSEPPAIQGARAFSPDGRSVALEYADGAYGAAGGGEDLRFMARYAEGETLTVYHARFGRRETRAVGDLELVPTMLGGNVFRLFWKGSPVGASQVNVATSEGWSRTLRPDSDGTVSFHPSFPALYVLEVSARVDGAVAVDGRKYKSARHVATLSFRVDR